MPQHSYILTVTDKSGKALDSACAYFLDADKAPIVVNGQPVFVEFYKQTLALGATTQTFLKSTINSDQNPLTLRIASKGFTDKIVTLAPGQTTVQLEDAKKEELKRNFKGLLIVVVIVIVVIAAVKYFKVTSS